MASRSAFTLSEVAKHKSKNDCWLVIYGLLACHLWLVLNITKFLEEHPGGDVVLLEVAGKDASEDFHAVGHSKATQNLMLDYQVGALEGYTLQETDDRKQATEASFHKSRKEMRAFVVKDEKTQKYAHFLEFFIPLVVAGSYPP